jgi:tetrapyrrole methylase family protein/MazG family protein
MGITVVGLGPGSSDLLTRQAWDILSAADTIYLRTERHPAVTDLPDTARHVSMDHHYEAAENFEEVYERIVSELLQQGRGKDIVYAVPGHPFIGESTVTALVEAAGSVNIPLSIVPGLSFVEAVLSAVKLDGLDGLQLLDAIELASHRFPPVNANAPLLLGQVYNRLLASELKMTLTAVYPEEHPVHLIHAAGTRYERVESIPLYAIDRSDRIDHLTSLYVPALPDQATLPALAETVAVLRSPDGCPWDQEQTPQSMRSGFLEEASEVLAALDAGDPANLCEELGDMLYHLVMQVQMATESEEFKLTDVVSGIDSKLKRRHPHVWGDWEVANTAEVLRNWEQLKQAEKAGSPVSLLDEIPLALPALARSQKIQTRVRSVGFDWPNIAGVYAKLDEEIAELKAAASPAQQQAELGDILFVLSNLGLWLDVDAESALREGNQRFDRRFRRLEALLAERGLNWDQMDLPTMDRLWEEVKGSLANAEQLAKVEETVASSKESL